jgi:hypothetical protein
MPRSLHEKKRTRHHVNVLMKITEQTNNFAQNRYTL